MAGSSIFVIITSFATVISRSIPGALNSRDMGLSYKAINQLILMQKFQADWPEKGLPHLLHFESESKLI